MVDRADVTAALSATLALVPELAKSECAMFPNPRTMLPGEDCHAAMAAYLVADYAD
jgi:hypothetical protein